jgi:hypothetical protein
MAYFFNVGRISVLLYDSRMKMTVQFYANRSLMLAAVQTPCQLAVMLR